MLVSSVKCQVLVACRAVRWCGGGLAVYTRLRINEKIETLLYRTMTNNFVPMCSNVKSPLTCGKGRDREIINTPTHLRHPPPSVENPVLLNSQQAGDK